jgi:ABC-type transporter Mla MlaB component
MILYQHDHAAMFRFVIVGELAGPAVEELRCAWETACSVLRGRELVLDLSGVTAVDPQGLALLSRLKDSGARISSRQVPECAEIRPFLAFAPALAKEDLRPRGRFRDWLRFARFSE